MTAIHIDCRKKRALARLRNNYVALQEEDPSHEQLTMATLDDDGWGLTLSDKFFESYMDGSGEGALKDGCFRYLISLRAGLIASMERRGARG
ncbi:MAG TPA: hypothetical protein ENH99_02310 [Candidatus Pacearchaeota archaeon]|nr:hypothetical protein [Candidatus Pacearchaeota archaeon]